LPDPLAVLNNVFGYADFRGQQGQVIDHVMAGGDALVLMPTGGGKSLCYQVPALCLDGLTVVVSPLIALMQDQVAALRQLGVEAAALNSSLPQDERRAVERAMVKGELSLVYVAPERLVAPGFLELLGRCRLALFAIDEAHCVSQWGHDFRPDYLEVNRLHAHFPDVPRLALTATADRPTQKDIVDRLELGGGRVFMGGFDRPNIRYRLAIKNNPRRQLLELIKGGHQGEAGIVYCLSRHAVDELAQWLEGEGIAALPYHAGLDPRVREANQTRFLKEEGLVMVATIAFGMGIDKPDVRFVVHLGLPKSLEAYYQETGRAGRDGLPSQAVTFYGVEDITKLRGFIANGNGDPERARIERQKFEALVGYCETAGCRRQVLLGYFGETHGGDCGNCDNCLDPPRTYDGSEAARKLLSAVYRTGQRFGAGHVIDVLRGVASDRVKRLGHDRLSVFGVGGDLDAATWRSILRQLVAQNLLIVDVEGHGGLSLGADVRPVLKGEQPVRLRQDPKAAAGRTRTQERRGAAEAESLDPRGQALLERLKAWRRETAREQGVPPYVVFHDTTLIAIARMRPASRDTLRVVPGMGATKLERYGEALLNVLRREG